MIKVLLADDESLEREALKIILQKRPEEFTIVGEASSFEMALLMNEKCNPDIILLDSTIPGILSTNVTQIVSRQWAEKTIIVLKDFDSIEHPFQQLNKHCFSISKPIRPNKLLTTLDHCFTQLNYPSTQVEAVMEEVCYYIQLNDYKRSKEKLKNFFQFISEHQGNREVVRKSLNELINAVVQICNQKGIEPLKHTTKSIESNYFLSQVEKQLSEMLIHFFNEIIRKNQCEDKKQIQSALNYIEKHYKRCVTLEEVAEYVHLTPHYLSKLFKKELDINFIHYISERRMELAKDLLARTDMPILNISLELSYQEPNYFSKVFRKSTGMTPSEYRKQKGNNKVALLKRNHYIPNAKWYI